MARSADLSRKPIAMIDERPRTLAETFAFQLNERHVRQMQ